MYITKNAVKLAQRAMQFPELFITGLLDQRMEYRLDQVLSARKAELSTRHRDAILSGGRNRKLTAYIQLLGKDKGIETGAIDGLWGQMTDFTYDSLIYFEKYGTLPTPWRDPVPNNTNPHNWPGENQAALTAHYGSVNSISLAKVELPYTMRINWDVSVKVNRFSCHPLVADSIKKVLTNVKDHYGVERIKELHLDLWGGCYNKRKKRGGTQWSTHAWGIAIDFDTQRNQLHWGRDRAAFARPEYEKWWELWEAEGWISLGRIANYDWMHVQAARR